MIYPKLVPEFISNKLPMFSCVWLPPEYEVLQTFEPLPSFTENRGYSPGDIHEITNLELGECAKFGKFHYVTRVN